MTVVLLQIDLLEVIQPRGRRVLEMLSSTRTGNALHRVLEAIPRGTCTHMHAYNVVGGQQCNKVKVRDNG